MNTRIPDLNSYPWAEIIKLRFYSFFNCFREKTALLYDEISKENHKITYKLVNDIARKDLKEMIEVFKPNVKQTIVKRLVMVERRDMC